MNYPDNRPITQPAFLQLFNRLPFVTNRQPI